MSNIKQSIGILEQATNVAVSKGIFTIEEKAVIYSHLFEIAKYIENNETALESVKEDDSKLVKAKK